MAQHVCGVRPLHSHPQLSGFASGFDKAYHSSNGGVFIMMRYHETETMRTLKAAISRVLQRYQYDAVLANEYDFTGQIASNIEVCMHGCNLGIAIFEDIDEPDSDPNVTYELGYILGL